MSLVHLSEAQRRDAEIGMAWWNALPEYSRALWLQRAGSACPADAWRLYKSTLKQPARGQGGAAAPGVRRIAVGTLAQDGDAYLVHFGDDELHPHAADAYDAAQAAQEVPPQK